MTGPSTRLFVTVSAITQQAESIRSFELRPAPGTVLPPFSAGAHVDLHLSNGLVRSYSLVNPQEEHSRYVIAVSNDPGSRGGSRFMHESVRENETLTISPPRNNFPLAEDAEQSLLIAGGIGITPIWSMIQRLEALGRSWELYYCARTRAAAAFTRELERFGDRVHFIFDREPGVAMLDVAKVVARADARTHLYCCGPSPLLAAFEAACAGRPEERVHVEYFAGAVPGGPGRQPDRSFTVVLARSGGSVEVPADKSILEAVLEAGVDAPFSCREGACGTCETKVLGGVPDHRDVVLTPSEKESNRTMMICCSRATTERLELDL